MQAAAVIYPHQLHPTTLGSDPSNYIAAAERVIAHHDLYALNPGDRPAPADNPPEWSVPILYPPTTATLFVPLALLPDPLGLLFWWCLASAALVTFLAFFAARAPTIALLAGLPLALLLGITVTAGNVNAVLPLFALALWQLTEAEPRSERFEVIAGAMVAVAAGLKLGPAVFLPWLLGRQRFHSVLSFAATLGVLGGVSLLVTGGRAFTEYLAVGAQASSSATLYSPSGILQAIGVPAGAAALAPYALLVISAVASLVLRTRPRITFAIAAAVSVLASPAVRLESYGLLVMCAVPWLAVTGASAPGARGWVAGVALASAAGLMAAAVALGALQTSSLAIVNDSGSARVVRFNPPQQGASWGYELAPGQRGIAWGETWGDVTEPAVIYNLDCEVIDRVPVGPGRWTLHIAASSNRLAPGASEQEHLAYSALCASSGL